MNDERRKVGCEMTFGVVLVLLGIAVGLGGFAVIAAGCGSAGWCGDIGLAWLLPVVIGALLLAGGVAVLWAASRDFDAQGTSTYPVQQPSADATQPGPEQPSDG